MTETPGGGAFQFPTLTQGDSVVIGLPSFTVRRDGLADTSKRVLQGVRFGIGRRDARSTGGTIRFQVGNPANTPVEGTNLTTALNWNFTGAELQTAMNALSGKPATATVEEVAGSFLVRWGALTAHTTITPRQNRLVPISAVDVLQYIRGEDYVSELRLVQAPVAFADAVEDLLGPAPTVARVMAGGANGEVQWSEVQDLEIPSSFRGTLLLQRGDSKTEAITRETTAEELSALLNANLAVTGELFEVQSIEGTNKARIVFGGDLAGVAHGLLSVVITETPPGDPTVILNLTAPELNAVLRDAKNGSNLGEIKLPYELRCDLENESDDTKTDVVCFQGEVVIKAKVILDAASLAANLDWLRPPSPKNYRPRGTGQIANGVRHWSGPRGNGSATEFEIDHDLATDALSVMVRRNVTDGELLSLGVDYAVSFGNNNTLTIEALGSWVTSPPTADEWLVAILGMAGASQYDEHTHSIDEVGGLRDELDALGESVSALQSVAGVGSVGSFDSQPGEAVLEIALPTFAEAYPMRAALLDLMLGKSSLANASTTRVVSGGATTETTTGTVEPSEVVRIADIPFSILPKDGGLIGAIHDAVVEDFPGSVPAPGDANKGKVWRNSGSVNIALPGGSGRSRSVLKPGEFAGSDGRFIYKVARQSAAGAAKVFTAATDDVCTSAAHGWSNGQKVMVSSAGTLPAGLAVETTYFVIDAATDAFKLSLTAGGAAVDVTSTGSGVHSVFAAPAATFYPVDFEREIPIGAISGDMLTVKRQLTARLGFEVAILNAKTQAPRISDKLTRGQWEFRLEWGMRTSETTPATPDTNLKGIAWNATPILSRVVDVTAAPTVHTFGLRVTRTGVSTWAVEKLLYGLWSASAATINTADFHLRARWTRADVEDIEDARGFFVLLGCGVSVGAGDKSVGKLTIE